MKFQQLKDFCNKLTEEQLQKEVYFHMDNDYSKREEVTCADVIEEDIYVHDYSDGGDYLTLKGVEESLDLDTHREDFHVAIAKGEPYLSNAI